MKIAVTGATGFIGRELLVRLALAQHDCTALVRNPALAATLPCRPFFWTTDPKIHTSFRDFEGAISGVDAIVHLAGEPVAAGRWSTTVKKKIRDSRVLGTRKLVESISRLPAEQRPKTLICASAVGYYGDRADAVLTEASQGAQGFLGDVCREWEEEAVRAEQLGLRVVRMRLGVVLGLGGGALEKTQPVILGSGRQWMSWVHIKDVARFIEFALANNICSGAYNLAAPNPETNASFTAHYAGATGARFVLKAPALSIRAALGEMSQIVLHSSRAIPQRAIEAGFTFQYATLDAALAQIYPQPLERKFTAAQFIARPISEVFSFFSRPENLETITPPWLNFHVLKSTAKEINENTLIDYKLKIHGVPVRWQSRIERWEPERCFVDTQTKGPYTKWHHTHLFEKVPGGTLVLDEVIYQVPGGRFGSLLGNPFVNKDILKIFSFRRQKIAQVFS